MVESKFKKVKDKETIIPTIKTTPKTGSKKRKGITEAKIPTGKTNLKFSEKDENKT